MVLFCAYRYIDHACTMTTRMDVGGKQQEEKDAPAAPDPPEAGQEALDGLSTPLRQTSEEGGSSPRSNASTTTKAQSALNNAVPRPSGKELWNAHKLSSESIELLWSTDRAKLGTDEIANAFGRLVSRDTGVPTRNTGVINITTNFECPPLSAPATQTFHIAVGHWVETAALGMKQLYWLDSWKGTRDPADWDESIWLCLKKVYGSGSGKQVEPTIVEVAEQGPYPDCLWHALFNKAVLSMHLSSKTYPLIPDGDIIDFLARIKPNIPNVLEYIRNCFVSNELLPLNAEMFDNGQPATKPVNATATNEHAQTNPPTNTKGNDKTRTNMAKEEDETRKGNGANERKPGTLPVDTNHAHSGQVGMQDAGSEPEEENEEGNAIAMDVQNTIASVMDIVRKRSKAGARMHDAAPRIAEIMTQCWSYMDTVELTESELLILKCTHAAGDKSDFSQSFWDNKQQLSQEEIVKKYLEELRSLGAGIHIGAYATSKLSHCTVVLWRFVDGVAMQEEEYTASSSSHSNIPYVLNLLQHEGDLWAYMAPTQESKFDDAMKAHMTRIPVRLLTGTGQEFDVYAIPGLVYDDTNEDQMQSYAGHPAYRFYLALAIMHCALSDVDADRQHTSTFVMDLFDPDDKAKFQKFQSMWRQGNTLMLRDCAGSVINGKGHAFAESSVGNVIKLHRARYMLGVGVDQPNTVLLDIGCGTGVNLLRISEFGKDVVAIGVEKVAETHRVAHEILSKLNDNAEDCWICARQDIHEFKEHFNGVTNITEFYGHREAQQNEQSASLVRKILHTDTLEEWTTTKYPPSVIEEYGKDHPEILERFREFDVVTLRNCPQGRHIRIMPTMYVKKKQYRKERLNLSEIASARSKVTSSLNKDIVDLMKRALDGDHGKGDEEFDQDNFTDATCEVNSRTHNLEFRPPDEIGATYKVYLEGAVTLRNGSAGEKKFAIADEVKDSLSTCKGRCLGFMVEETEGHAFLLLVNSFPKGSAPTHMIIANAKSATLVAKASTIPSAFIYAGQKLTQEIGEMVGVGWKRMVSGNKGLGLRRLRLPDDNDGGGLYNESSSDDEGDDEGDDEEESQEESESGQADESSNSGASSSASQQSLGDRVVCRCMSCKKKGVEKLVSRSTVNRHRRAEAKQKEKNTRTKARSTPAVSTSDVNHLINSAAKEASEKVARDLNREWGGKVAQKDQGSEWKVKYEMLEKVTEQKERWFSAKEGLQASVAAEQMKSKYLEDKLQMQKENFTQLEATREKFDQRLEKAHKAALDLAEQAKKQTEEWNKTEEKQRAQRQLDTLISDQNNKFSELLKTMKENNLMKENDHMRTTMQYLMEQNKQSDPLKNITTAMASLSNMMFGTKRRAFEQEASPICKETTEHRQRGAVQHQKCWQMVRGRRGEILDHEASSRWLSGGPCGRWN